MNRSLFQFNFSNYVLGNINLYKYPECSCIKRYILRYLIEKQILFQFHFSNYVRGIINVYNAV